MSDTMNPKGNPVVSGGRAVVRHGGIVGRPYKPYRAGEELLGDFAKPDKYQQCALLDDATGVEFLIRVPANTHQFTVWYGRWVYLPGDNVGVWVDDNFQQVTGVDDGEYVAVRMDNPGLDLVGMYIEDTDVTSSESYRMWIRGLAG